MRESSQRSANLQLHLGPRKNEGIAEDPYAGTTISTTSSPGTCTPTATIDNKGNVQSNGTFVLESIAME
jgi:hypothetical protein